MKELRPFLASVLLGLCMALSAGCPQTTPILAVDPAALDFGTEATQDTFTIFNRGGGSLPWSVSASEPWLAADRTTGAVSTGTDRVRLTVDRLGLSPGTYQGTVTVRSGSQESRVHVAMAVAGNPAINVSPRVIALPRGSLGAGVEATITISNPGDEQLVWNFVLLQSAGSGQTVAFPPSLAITPQSGALDPGAQAQVQVDINPEELAEGRSEFALEVRSSAGTVPVTISIGQATGAQIGLSTDVLEFGRNTNQLQFSVFNAGSAGSTLNFNLSSDRPDLILVSPSTGVSTGVGPATDLSNFDLVPITVTVNRSALEGASDGGTISVSAPGLQPAQVAVSVEAAPLTFEGPINRTRRPYILRFVFLLRDGTGEAIDTTDPEVFAELQDAFTILEDGEPLETDETNSFLAGPEGLRYNVLLMLDMTGSMYNAPPGQGALIEQSKQSAKAFISNLPDSWRLALMEYHERQQTQRLIHGFSTDQQSLTDALDAFRIPPAEHGASELYDALMDAIQRLANEDATALPFDDADVRALIFISDGRDTSSLTTSQEVIEFARENRVRLYPISFGPNPDEAILVEMATDTGGHFYPAPSAIGLVNLLEQDESLPAGNPGRILTELQRQLVLTYITLFQDGTHNYLIRANYRGLEGSFEEDAVLAVDGDVRAGQLALTSSGIMANGRAELYVRADYVPRNVSQLRVRFFTDLPYSVEPVGLLADWTLVDEGGGVFTILTTEDEFLQYGAFGPLLKLTFNNVPVDRFTVGFRHDNRILINPPFSKYFQYPLALEISEEGSSQAAEVPVTSETAIDPDAQFAFDPDEDGVPDFDDRFPTDPERS